MKKQLKVGGSSIQQLPSGTYRVRLDLGKDPITGKRRMTSVSGDTPLQVIEKANVILAGNKFTTDKSTLGAAMDEYIRTCELAGHSASTIRGYRVIRRNAFLDLASVRVEMLKPMDIQRSINARAASHSPKTIKNEYGLLHKVLRATAPSLDLSGIVLPSNKNKQDEEEDQVVIQSEQDIINLLADVRHDPDLYLAVLICSQTGLRRGQVCALKWSDINLAEQTISVTKSMVKSDDGSWSIKAPKSRAGKRTISISKGLASLLQEYKGKPKDQVINANPNAITERYIRVRDRLGIPGRFHDLRHYHCSIMVALGVPPEYIMSDMGHETDGLYRKVYTHMFPDQQQKMYDALASYTDKFLVSQSK